MSDIEDKTYIYLLGQFDDNGELMFSESFKIGKADDLKQRFNQEYKNNTGYIHPRYIRVIEISKKIHNVPDKPIHALLLLCNPLIKRKSKHRELFAFDGPEALEYFDNKLCDLPAIIKYYADPQEIQELVERESIIKDVVNNLVSDVISENVDVTSNDIDTQSLEKSYAINISLDGYKELHKVFKSDICGKIYDEKHIDLFKELASKVNTTDAQKKYYVRDYDLKSLFFKLGNDKLNEISFFYDNNNYQGIINILSSIDFEENLIFKQYKEVTKINKSCVQHPFSYAQSFRNKLIEYFESL